MTKRRALVFGIACLAASSVLAWSAFARSPAYGVNLGYTPGNCTDPNVAFWFSFDQGNGNLSIPARCDQGGLAEAARRLVPQGAPTSPIYSTSAPLGLGNSITFSNTAGDRLAGATPNFFGSAGTNDMVVEFWVKVTNPVSPASQVILAQGGYASGGASGKGFFADIGSPCSSGYPHVSIGSVGAVVSTCSSSALETGWHFWRATWVNSTGTLSLYIDEVLKGTTTSGAAAGTSISGGRNFAVGYVADFTYGFVGSIADLRVTIGNATNDLGIGQTVSSRSTVASPRATPTPSRSTATPGRLAAQ